MRVWSVTCTAGICLLFVQCEEHAPIVPTKCLHVHFHSNDHASQYETKEDEGRCEIILDSALCKQLNQHTGTGSNSHDSVGKVHQHLPHQVNRVLRARRQRRVVGCGCREGRVVSQACNCVCMCGVPCLLTECMPEAQCAKSQHARDLQHILSNEECEIGGEDL